MKIAIDDFSSQYHVFKIGDEDILKVHSLCVENPTYYTYMKSPVTLESIHNDMLALPPGKEYEDKFYVGYSLYDDLIAVMDLIVKYPDDNTAFIGFFMMNKALQGKGVGSAIIKELLSYLKKAGFSYVRLGYVKENKESESFWLKNRFVQTGIEKLEEDYTIVILQREI